MSTYTPIASQTLTGSVSSVTFSNIPQNFTDLVVVCWTKAPSANVGLSMQFNGDTSSNYSYTQIAGSGTTAASNRGTSQTYARFGNNIQTNGTYTKADIQNYSNSTTFKTLISRSGSAADGGVVAFVNLWRSTSAITSLTISPEGGGNFGSDTTFNLYGIASGSAKATGGTVTTDGTYFYHTFTSSGIFTPSVNLTADYLVVAGGGGGGNGNFASNTDGGGGGGAGGLRCTVGSTGGGGSLESALSLTAQNYTVTVGAGGAGTSTAATNGTSGSNSVFSTITATGGGGGGGSTSSNGNAGLTGGSGGGGGPGVTPGAGGSGTANQGYAGGLASVSGRGGGGGGAGAVGATGATTMNGGTGVSTSISGSSITYAGGGGGGGYSAQGTGGSGGGGAGGISVSSTPGSAGTANTGGGGGGVGRDGVATGAGGSGIVIVRYAV